MNIAARLFWFRDICKLSHRKLSYVQGDGKGRNKGHKGK